jgi:uncharacterized membrane protein
VRISNANLRLSALLVVGVAFFLGDLGVFNVPTFFNGGVFSSEATRGMTHALVDSYFIMPILSWFLPFATVSIYLSFFYILFNRRVMFE